MYIKKALQCVIDACNEKLKLEKDKKNIITKHTTSDSEKRAQFLKELAESLIKSKAPLGVLAIPTSVLIAAALDRSNGTKNGEDSLRVLLFDKLFSQAITASEDIYLKLLERDIKLSEGYINKNGCHSSWYLADFYFEKLLIPLLYEKACKNYESTAIEQGSKTFISLWEIQQNLIKQLRELDKSKMKLVATNLLDLIKVTALKEVRSVISKIEEKEKETDFNFTRDRISKEIKEPMKKLSTIKRDDGSSIYNQDALNGFFVAGLRNDSEYTSIHSQKALFNLQITLTEAGRATLEVAEHYVRLQQEARQTSAAVPAKPANTAEDSISIADKFANTTQNREIVVASATTGTASNFFSNSSASSEPSKFAPVAESFNSESAKIQAL